MSHIGSSSSRATSVDVARLAGVSRATVSYVLNDNPRQTISNETRESVLRAAEKLGYRPNIAAKNLAAGDSGLIVFVTPHVSMGDLSAAIGSLLTTELARSGLTVAIHVESDPWSLTELCRNLHPRAVVSVFPLPDAVTQVLQSGNVRFFSTADSDSAAFAEMTRAGAVQQVDYLDSRSHTRVAYARPDVEELSNIADQREDALRDRCAERGMTVTDAQVLFSDGRNAKEVVARWHVDGVTAVCAYNDDVAFAVLQGIHGARLRCPEDISVIGLDGIPLGAVAIPPLTTIAISPSRAARFYAKLLLDLLSIPTSIDAVESVFTVVERVSA